MEESLKHPRQRRAEADYPSVLVRSDGSKVTFPEGARLFHVFERNSSWTAAGFDQQLS